MTFLQKLDKAVAKNNSLLCVGLDPKEIPLFSFCKTIIDLTHDLVCSYKPNSAFFEAYGAEGISELKKTCDYIREAYPEIAIILDFKRGDIGSTNEGYVKYAFDYLQVDAVTVHPYLGQEAMQTFLDRKDKGIIVLCKTSNKGSDEFQNITLENKLPVYKHVANQVKNVWNRNGNCLMVIGATYPAELEEVRKMVGEDMTLLIPGIGAQGGDVEKTVKAGLNSKKKGIVVNSSRGIIFADDPRAEAMKLRDEINKYR